MGAWCCTREATRTTSPRASPGPRAGDPLRAPARRGRVAVAAPRGAGSEDGVEVFLRESRGEAGGGRSETLETRGKQEVSASRVASGARTATGSGSRGAPPPASSLDSRVTEHWPPRPRVPSRRGLTPSGAAANVPRHGRSDAEDLR